MRLGGEGGGGWEEIAEEGNWARVRDKYGGGEKQHNR
jgi:hypothetical protein